MTAAGVAGGSAWYFLPRYGSPLPDSERAQLLEKAGLPRDFPTHPDARRMKQPAPGGISYSLPEPVPDVVFWMRQSLQRSGYSVAGTDLQGQDQYGERWLLFESRARGGGAVIVRPLGGSFTTGTEVKILSSTDKRLAPPPIPSPAGSR
ncbi:MAG TPA: hypothetical protein VGW38_05405 [Chloroflexota bacterium]|nr:hypothetical protein [Chloroflexota bacterium]